MIVHWTENRMKVIPVLPTAEIPVAKLGGKANVILFPGYNHVEDIIFEAIKPHIKQDLARKRITIAVLPDKDGKGTSPIPIKAVPLDKLKTMMKKTVSVTALREWLSKETRQDARFVIQQRLTEIEAELAKGGQGTEEKEEEPSDSDEEGDD